METTPIVLQEFSDSIKRVEAQAGLNILDEAQFSKGAQVSFRNFVEHITRNAFLEEGEKKQLIQKVDEKVSGVVGDVLSKLDGAIDLANQEALQDITLQMTLLSREATGLINGLTLDVERQLRAKQTGFEGVSDEEFHEIMDSLSTATLSLPDYALEESDSVSTAVEQFQGPARAALLLRSTLGQETVYLKENTPTTVLLFTVTDPKVCLNLPIEPLPSPIELTQKIAEVRAEMKQKAEVDKTTSSNLQQVLVGHTEALRPVDTGWDKLSPTQSMAVDSAYNMGLDAARSVKMQLLLFKVAQKKGYTLPADFVLDGGWGPTSNAALKSVLSQEHLPYVEGNAVQNVKTLMALHHRVFPSDNTELFLTAEEINDPRYKFENKGVYRGMKVHAIKDRLLKNGFNIEQLAEEKVFGNDITPQVKEAFPRALVVLQKLTSNKDLQASVLGTMIMESGLSSTADEWGMGRGDRKDYASYLSENWPRTSAVYNEYAPGPRLETNSSGIMQVNYKTAQVMLQEKLGQYYPKDVLVGKLEKSVELSTVIAFVVYQDNHRALQKAESLYAAPSST